MKSKYLCIICFVLSILVWVGCNSSKSYKYHTFVYAYNEQNESAQCCVVVCGQPDDDEIWVELPQSYYEATGAIAADSCCYWYVATSDLLGYSYHNFYFTGDRYGDYRLFSNDTGFTVGLREEMDYVFFNTSQSRTPLIVPLQRRVIYYER